MKTLDQVKLENMIWMRELMLAKKKDITKIEADIKILMLRIEERKWSANK